MYKILVVALFAACMVNVVSLCGHLGGTPGLATGAAKISPVWIASASALPAAAD